MISRRSLLGLLGSGLGIAGIPGRVELPVAAVNRPPGGPVKKAPRGVVAEVLLAKKRYVHGEPIPFAFRIVNDSRVPITYRTAYFSYFHLVEVRTRGVSALLTEQGEQERRLFGGGRIRRGRNRVEVLAPGDSYKNGNEADPNAGLLEGLDDLFHLFPGSYTVRVTYEEIFWPNPYRVVTPPVPFEVV